MYHDDLCSQECLLKFLLPREDVSVSVTNIYLAANDRSNGEFLLFNPELCICHYRQYVYAVFVVFLMFVHGVIITQIATQNNDFRLSR